MRFTISITLLLAVFAAVFVMPNLATADKQPSVISTGNKSQPVELGEVHWLRDIDLAAVTARKANRPLAVLFQEVPG